MKQGARSRERGTVGGSLCVCPPARVKNEELKGKSREHGKFSDF